MIKQLFGILKVSRLRVCQFYFEFNSSNVLGQIDSHVIDLHKDSVLKVNFNHNGTLFATADMLGKIYVFDAGNNAMLYEVNIWFY